MRGFTYINQKSKVKGLVNIMDFFVSGIDMLQKLVVAIGGGLTIIGMTLVPLLKNLFS